MKYVIIGNSAAAVGAVEAIRKNDQEGSVTIVSKEPYHTYSRPLISYLLCGKTDEQRMKYRPDDFYEQNNVTFLGGKTAVHLDPEAKEVKLDDDSFLNYDKLLVATGSVPFVPPTEGIDCVKSKFSFMSLDDARELESALFQKARVLIVGAGLIGLKCAEGIADKVAEITVVDLAPRILPSILDEKGSAMMQAHLEKRGLHFLLSDSVDSFSENFAVLKSGRTVPFDILVMAVGVRPNVSLVKDAGGLIKRGIVTDAFCRTSLPDVYAAGDCAQSHDITTDTDRVLALLPNAYMQGETAGLHMTGEEKPHDHAIPMNAIGFFGLHIITAGSYDGTEILVTDKPACYKKLYVRDNKLVGFILIGDIARAGIYTSLVRSQTPLDTIDFELICEKPQLMAFSRAYRAEKLGGKKE